MDDFQPKRAYKARAHNEKSVYWRSKEDERCSLKSFHVDFYFRYRPCRVVQWFYVADGKFQHNSSPQLHFFPPRKIIFVQERNYEGLYWIVVRLVSRQPLPPTPTKLSSLHSNWNFTPAAPDSHFSRPSSPLTITSIQKGFPAKPIQLLLFPSVNDPFISTAIITQLTSPCLQAKPLEKPFREIVQTKQKPLFPLHPLSIWIVSACICLHLPASASQLPPENRVLDTPALLCCT